MSAKIKENFYLYHYHPVKFWTLLGTNLSVMGVSFAAFIWSLELVVRLIQTGEQQAPLAYKLFLSAALLLFVLRLLVTLLLGTERMGYIYKMFFITMIGFDSVRVAFFSLMVGLTWGYPSHLPSRNQEGRLLSPWDETTDYEWGQDVQWASTLYTFCCCMAGFSIFLTVYQMMYDLDRIVWGKTKDQVLLSKHTEYYDTCHLPVKNKSYLGLIAVFSLCFLAHVGILVWLLVPTHRSWTISSYIHAFREPFFYVTVAAWGCLLTVLSITFFVSVGYDYSRKKNEAKRDDVDPFILKYKHFMFSFYSYLLIGAFCIITVSTLFVRFHQYKDDPQLQALQCIHPRNSTQELCQQVTPILTYGHSDNCTLLSAASYYWDTDDGTLCLRQQLRELRDTPTSWPRAILYVHHFTLIYWVLLPCGLFAVFRFLDYKIYAQKKDKKDTEPLLSKSFLSRSDSQTTLANPQDISGNTTTFLNNQDFQRKQDDLTTRIAHHKNISEEDIKQLIIELKYLSDNYYNDTATPLGASLKYVLKILETYDLNSVNEWRKNNNNKELLKFWHIDFSRKKRSERRDSNATLVAEDNDSDTKTLFNYSENVDLVPEAAIQTATIGDKQLEIIREKLNDVTVLKEDEKGYFESLKTFIDKSNPDVINRWLNDKNEHENKERKNKLLTYFILGLSKGKPIDIRQLGDAIDFNNPNHFSLDPPSSSRLRYVRLP